MISSEFTERASTGDKTAVIADVGRLNAGTLLSAGLLPSGRRLPAMFLLRRTPHRIQKDLSGKAEKMLRYWFCVDCFVEKVREETFSAFHLSAKPAEREPIGSIRMSFFRSAITFSSSSLTISILSSTREIGRVSGTDFGSASTS